MKNKTKAPWRFQPHGTVARLRPCMLWVRRPSTCIHTCIHICIYSIYIYVYVYIHTYIYKHMSVCEKGSLVKLQGSSASFPVVHSMFLFCFLSFFSLSVTVAVPDLTFSPLRFSWKGVHESHNTHMLCVCVTRTWLIILWVSYIMRLIVCIHNMYNETHDIDSNMTHDIMSLIYYETHSMYS